MIEQTENAGTEMRAETVVEKNIAAMVHELTNRSSTTLIERQGNDLVIKMTNGEEIVVESFFIAFTENEFHEMQAGLFEPEATDVIDVVEVADSGADTAEAPDADMASSETGSSTTGGGAMGPVMAGIGGLAALGGIAGAGGGGGGGSSDDDDDDAAVDDQDTMLLATDLPEEQSDTPADATAEEVPADGVDDADQVAEAEASTSEEMTQEEFAALFAIDGEETYPVEGSADTMTFSEGTGDDLSDMAMAYDPGPQPGWDEAAQPDLI